MTLLDLVRMLRKNALLLGICAAVGLLLGAGWTLTRPSVYQAQSLGLVVASDTATVASTQGGDLFAQTRAEMYTKLVGTRALADRVNAEVKRQNVSPGSYSAEVLTGTPFIRVTATASTGQAAQITADAALRGLVAEALRMETYGKAQQGVPESELARQSSVHVMPYEAATAPTSPQRPGLLRNTGLGLVAGLAIGVLAAFARRQLDVRVRTQADIETLSGKSVLGIVPDARELKRARRRGIDQHLKGQVGEAMRKLRTNLRFVHVDSPVRSLVVTSANPGEGKSTIAANLAQLVAQSGQPVIMLDCDLRRPVQSTVFGVDSSVGLSQVLAGDLTAADALVETGVPGLLLLPAGRIPPNPSELLGSKKMADLIHTLSREAMVIIDAPPMLAVTDASLLTSASDGALFVTVAGRTPKDHLRTCMKQFDLVHGTLLGSVLNRVPKSGMGDAMYGYGGYYSSREQRYYSTRKAATGPAVVPEAPALPGDEPRADGLATPMTELAVAPEAPALPGDEPRTSEPSTGASAFARPRRLDDGQ